MKDTCVVLKAVHIYMLSTHTHTSLQNDHPQALYLCKEVRIWIAPVFSNRLIHYKKNPGKKFPGRPLMFLGHAAGVVLQLWHGSCYHQDWNKAPEAQKRHCRKMTLVCDHLISPSQSCKSEHTRGSCSMGSKSNENLMQHV